MKEHEVDVVQKRGFTVVNNSSLDDKRLDFKTRGVLATMLRLPPEWDFTIAGLATLTPDGKAAVRTAIQKLEELHYIRREQTRREDGSFKGSKYTVYDEPYDAPLSDFRTSDNRTSDNPTTDNPTSDNPTTDNPTSGNPTSDNPTSENRTEINNNKINNIPPISPKGESRDQKPAGDKPSFPHDHEAYRCAQYLDGEIRKRVPQKQPAAEATLQSWAADFDRCHRLDGYDWKTVMDALIFSQQDSFWQVNILSGRKFRAKLLQLMAKMNGAGRATAVSGSSGGYIPEAKTGW